jgi:predicted F0F1-ATPase subunit
MDEPSAPISEPPPVSPASKGIARRAAEGRLELMRSVGAVGSVGLSFVVAIVLGTALGVWLDRLTGWSPVFFFVFFVLGLVAGVLNVYRAVSRLK